MPTYDKPMRNVSKIAVWMRQSCFCLSPQQRTRTPIPGMRRQRGQALVEFMIVLPVLLLLILGLVAIGQLLLANYTVNQAARAAAHQAAISGGADEAAYIAAEHVINAGVGTSYANATTAVRCSGSPCRRYDAITVTIAYTGAFWTPFPGFERFTVHASATRAAERDQQ